VKKAVKYTFSEDFGAAPAAASETAAEEARAAELEAVRAAAYADGHKDGLLEATQGLDAENQQLFSQIITQLGQLGEGWKMLEASTFTEAAKLAHSIGSHLANRLMEKHPLGEVEAVIQEALALCIGEPRLVIRVSDQTMEVLKEKLDTLSQQAAFPGKIILLGEQSLGPSDCLIEWADGGIERRVADIEDDIHTLMRRYFDASEASTQGGQSDV